MKSFDSRVNAIFGGVCKKFNLLLFSARAEDVFLRGGDFALRFWLDRDGVSLTYVRRVGKDLREYPLGHYLVTNRLWVVAPEILDDLDRNLNSYRLTLETSCGDILSGDVSWLVRLSPYPVVLPSGIADLLQI
jgi:hypothetical protein